MNKIKTDYSKSCGDINKEELERIAIELELIKKQKNAVAFLQKFQNRTNCILCNQELAGENFKHRDLTFVVCKNCGHIQTKILPPKDYPFLPETGYEYKSIYPYLDG